MLIPHPQISPSRGLFFQRMKNCKNEILLEFEKAKQKEKAIQNEKQGFQISKIKQKDSQIKVLMRQPGHKWLKLP